MKQAMNYDILKLVSKSAAFAWHAIRDGFNWMQGIQERVDLKKVQAHSAINELLQKGLIVRVGRGSYKVRETELGVRETELEVREIELGVRETELSGSHSSENRTKELQNSSSENRTNSSIKRTGSSENRTGSSENRTLSAQHTFKRTDVDDNDIDGRDIFLEVDRSSAQYLNFREKALELFQEAELSRDLVDRIAAAWVLQVPGTGVTTLLSVKKKALPDVRAGKLKFVWIRLSKHLKPQFKKAGYRWDKCRPALDAALEEGEIEEVFDPKQVIRKSTVSTRGTLSEEECRRIIENDDRIKEKAASAQTLRREILDKAKSHEAEVAAAQAEQPAKPSKPKRDLPNNKLDPGPIKSLEEALAEHGPIKATVLTKEEFKAKYGYWHDTETGTTEGSIPTGKPRRAGKTA